MKLLVLIVSHAHGSLAARCAAQILEGFSRTPSKAELSVDVVLLHNIAEPTTDSTLYKSNVTEIWNVVPAGFARNHNQIFLRPEGYANDADWLLIANPDLDWGTLGAFEPLIHSLQTLPPTVGAITLGQMSSKGQPIDFLRRLITPWQLVTRVFTLSTRKPTQLVPTDRADWFNGACMLVRKKAFVELQGFDERYHMYCEDVDFCIRLQLAGWKLGASDANVTHDGRRSSRKQWRFFLIHMVSLLKLWSSSAYWQYLRLRASGNHSGFFHVNKPTAVVGAADHRHNILTSK